MPRTTLTRVRGIVIGRHIYGESDLYLHVIADELGFLSLSAKAGRKSRRRYAGGLDLFCHNEFCLSTKGSYIRELVPLNLFLGLRSSLERLSVAGDVLACLRRLAVAGASVPELYALLGQTLALLENETRPSFAHLLRVLFYVKLLTLLGFSMQLTHCALCHALYPTEKAQTLGSPTPPFVILWIEKGGVVCMTCRAQGGRLAWDEWELSEKGYALLRFLQHLRFTQWASLPLSVAASLPDELFPLVCAFFTYHTGIRLGDTLHAPILSEKTLGTAASAFPAPLELKPNHHPSAPEGQYGEVDSFDHLHIGP